VRSASKKRGSRWHTTIAADDPRIDVRIPISINARIFALKSSPNEPSHQVVKMLLDFYEANRP
jgi:hypothetical protein